MRAFARTKEMYDIKGASGAPQSEMLDWVIEMDFESAKSGNDS